ncbi:MAG: putative basic amino acid antiporter YfcC [Bacteroidales bacterium]|nr:putative basic amino acid antiporter YfcC [Bacteroidales bacterium]
MKKFPDTYVIISGLILLCAVVTWIMPGAVPQTWQIFTALYDGFVRQAGIIVFILIIGGSFWLVNESKAIEAGISAFLNASKSLEKHAFFRKIGVNNIVLVLTMLIFSAFGAVFGMSEETIAFVAVLIPLAIAMGYDSVVGVCMVYLAAHVGFAGAFLNPFTIGIAQGMADLPPFSGMGYRLVCWIILTLIMILFVLRYAAKVRRDPTSSPLYHEDKHWRSLSSESASVAVSGRQIAVLCLLALTIVMLVVGVVVFEWYLPELSALFLFLGIATGVIMGFSANNIAKNFVAGAKDILSAAMVVGLASGIIIVLENGQVLEPMLASVGSLVGTSGRSASLSMMYGIQTLINLAIPSASAKAAITIPIMAPFSDMIGISRQSMVLAFQFGDGFTNMITPTSGTLIAVLGMARIPFVKWVKFIWRFVVVLIVVGFVLLLGSMWLHPVGF